jgi:hypothetical protein
MYFKPGFSSKTRRIMITLIVSFLVFISWMILFSDKTFGISMAVISLVLLFMIVFEIGRFGWNYTVDSDGIRIKRTFKRYFIASDLIASVKEISQVQASKLVQDAKNGKMHPLNNKSGGINSQIAYGRLIGYSSVPIVESKIKKQQKSGGRRSSGIEKFILVKNKDGKQYILSPLDSIGFLRECKGKN